SEAVRGDPDHVDAVVEAVEAEQPAFVLRGWTEIGCGTSRSVRVRVSEGTDLDAALPRVQGRRPHAADPQRPGGEALDRPTAGGIDDDAAQRVAVVEHDPQLRAPLESELGLVRAAEAACEDVDPNATERHVLDGEAAVGRGRDDVAEANTRLHRAQ